jgi:hydrogenase maturation protease
MSSPMRIAVIGVGQTMRGDDACGIETVRQWQEKFPETASRREVLVETSELPGLSLLNMIEDVNAVVLVDAVKSSSRPGTILLLEPAELFAFAVDSQSAHGWGVAETLQLSHEVNPASKNIPFKLIGIEVEQVNMGNCMSRAVREAIPLACMAIQDEIERLLN